MSRSAHSVSSVVFCSGAIPVLMAQTEIALGETILRLPCPCSAPGTLRRSMLSMTAHRALSELVPSFLLLPTPVRLGMGGSWVVSRQFATLPGQSSVSGVLVLSFVEMVLVVRVAVVVLWRLTSPRFLVPRFCSREGFVGYFWWNCCFAMPAFSNSA